MKKRLIVVLCCVLAVLLVGGGVAWRFLPQPLNYPIGKIEAVGSSVEIVSEREDEIAIRKTGAEPFKVLMFTDMHLDGKNETSYETVRHLVENIQKEKPDLVLLGGDNVTSGLNGTRCRQLAKIFEKLGVYWAGVIGNHEGDNPWSVRRKRMVGIFAGYEHCLMRGGLRDVSGDCNYVLNVLRESDSILEAFFFLDTYDEMSNEQKARYGLDPEEDYYDGVREDQVEWYARKVEDLRARYGHYSSVLLAHIPLPQVAAAAEKGEFLYGVQNEGVCCSGFDSGLFDAIKASGTTKAVFCGHDHLNTFGVSYEGILLSYIEPSGYGSYNMGNRRNAPESEWLQGCTELTLLEDGRFEQRQIRNHAQ